MKMKNLITLTVNGVKLNKEVDTDYSLLKYLRDDLGLMGTKNGCEKGHWGTCTIMIGGLAKRACIIKMSKIDGANIETIEGLSYGDKLHYIQQAYIDEGAVQC